MASERSCRDRRHRDRRAPVRRASLGLDAKGRQELVVWQASSNQSLREVAINFISGLGKKGRLHQRSVRRGLRIDQFRCEVAEVPSNAGAARTSSTLGKPLRHLRSSAFAGSGQHAPSPLRSSSASAEERGGREANQSAKHIRAEGMQQKRLRHSRFSPHSPEQADAVEAKAQLDDAKHQLASQFSVRNFLPRR